MTILAALAAWLCFSTTPESRWVRLCDKGPHAPPPGTRAWEDAPVRPDLLDSLRARGFAVKNIYAWENLAAVVPPASGAALPACVEDAGPVAKAIRDKPSTVAARSRGSTGVNEYTLALDKIWKAMGIEAGRGAIRTNGWTPGAGVVVAVMDGRFVRDHQVLHGIRVADDSDFVGHVASVWDTTPSDWPDIHGTGTAGLIASSWEDAPGIAPGATFLLYRTEDESSETSVEEDNLAAALVRAASKGADVVSVSLGYRFVDDANTVLLHPASEYDGHTLVATRAVNACVRRGILVVVSVGNEAHAGIGSPADADSVLSVGAIDANGRACTFSSWGLTASGRPKPEVSAFGCPVPVAGGSWFDQMQMENGTSFAAPVVAGLAVLAHQLNPGLRGWELRQRIIASSSLAAAPDSVRGSGIPNLVALIPGLGAGRGASPVTWSASDRTLRFHASSALPGGRFGIEISSLQGRRVFRTEGHWYDAPLWQPSQVSTPREPILVARWWGDYGEGTTRLLNLP